MTTFPRCAMWKRAAVAMLLGATMLGAGRAAAQDLTVGWNPRSGDVWVDTWLGDINRYGARYREPFIDELVRYHGAPRDLVVELVDRRRWQPGDVYYACALAAILGRPCRYVVDVYERDRGEGWGAIAQRLGVKPGSPEFHRLKRGFVPTYDRWARPIELDDELHRAYPKRGKDRAPVAGKRPAKKAAASARAAAAKAKAPAGRGAAAARKAPPRSASGQGGKGKDAGKKQGKSGGKGND